jgi:hypothetical protein
VEHSTFDHLAEESLFGRKQDQQANNQEKNSPNKGAAVFKCKYYSYPGAYYIK